MAKKKLKVIITNPEMISITRDRLTLELLKLKDKEVLEREKQRA